MFSIRTLTEPVWKSNPFENKRLLVGILGGAILIAAPFLIPGLGKFLSVIQFSEMGNRWMRGLVVAVLMFVAIELMKLLMFRKK